MWLSILEIILIEILALIIIFGINIHITLVFIKQILRKPRKSFVLGILFRVEANATEEALTLLKLSDVFCIIYI